MTAEDRLPLDDMEIMAAFAGVGSAPRLMVAVSGGPDSMALMAALGRWRSLVSFTGRIVVATVDHGLRAEARQEAEMVGAEAARLGMIFHLLSWQGDKPKTGIQEAARDARYRLLFECCRAEDIDTLLTAHTLDDQAETILMRLARGSGISGLRGMVASREIGSIRLVRPLLGFAKQRLIASCEAWAVPYVNDPSNESAAYTRVRWRKLLPVLAEEGLDASRISAFGERLGRADDALAVMTEKAIEASRISSGDEDIGIRFDSEKLFAEPLEIVIRAFSRMVTHIADSGQHVRLHRIEDCVAAIQTRLGTGRSLRRTLGGIMISLDRHGVLSFQPEPERRRGRYVNSTA